VSNKKTTGKETELSGGLFNLTFYDAIIIYVTTQANRLKAEDY